MTFFVKYNGDLDKDPLDRGVEDFADYESAFEFAKRMTNKGLATTIYSGTIIDAGCPDRQGSCPLHLADLR